MPDLDEPWWQCMLKEAPNEIDSIERHHLLLVAIGGVSPVKAHVSVFTRDQAAAGDSHTMRVARQILQDIFRSAKWPLRVDAPTSVASVVKRTGQSPQRA